MRLVFVEAASLTGYTAGSSTIGGAEASLAAIAESLAPAYDVTVVVTKLPRGHVEEIAGVSWVGPGPAALRAVRRADLVVVQRRVGLLPLVRLANRRAKLFVWYHDWYFAPGGGRRARWTATAKAGLRTVLHRATATVAVVVSRTHATNLREHLALSPVDVSGVRLEIVNNPVAQPERRPDVAVDLDKLVFFSAAWKGLDQVVSAFAAVRRRLPTVQLYVASPGYSAHVPDLHDDAVHYLGYLTHDELFDHVQSALCVFYPADQVPETFGLVFLESHAVGTPVLAHPFGAALEFLAPDELVDAHDHAAIAERLTAWRDGGRPTVSGDPDLGIEATSAKWRALLTSTAPSPPVLDR